VIEERDREEGGGHGSSPRPSAGPPIDRSKWASLRAFTLPRFINSAAMARTTRSFALNIVATHVMPSCLLYLKWNEDEDVRRAMPQHLRRDSAQGDQTERMGGRCPSAELFAN
jgi:hypothetical protein